MAIDFLLCHWKSEPRGRTLFDLVFLFNLSVNMFTDTHIHTHTDSLQSVTEYWQRAERLSCVVRCQTDSW